MRVPCHPFHRGDLYLQETIPWGFHPCQETVWKRCAKTGPSSFASSFRTLGWRSSGPKALEGFSLLRSLVTPSFETAMSYMKGGNLLKNETLLWSFLLNISVNLLLNSSACSIKVSETVMPVPPLFKGRTTLIIFFSDYWCTLVH